MSVTPGQLRAASDALATILPFDGPADAKLRAYFRNHPVLGSRDRAFVAESVYATLRHLASTKALTDEPTPRVLTLIGLVRWLGVSVRELGELIDNGERTLLAAAKGNTLADAPLATRLDLPPWLVERLLPRYGEAQLTELAHALNKPAPFDLRINTLKTSRDAVLARFSQEGIGAQPTPYSPLGVRLARHIALAKHPLFLDGHVEVQDEGSQLLGLLVEPKRDDFVVDLCAGAGGKSLLLGAAMRSHGRVYAFDVSEKRLDKLKPRLKRSGLSNLFPARIDNERDARLKRLAGKIDRVLVDAPCTGLGTLRRNPDLKWRQTPQDVLELNVKQHALLAAGAALLKPGGRLVYGTCSLLAEENEQIVSAFLSEHADFRKMPVRDVLARIAPGIECGDYLELLPHKHGTDGFFAAVLERAA